MHEYVQKSTSTTLPRKLSADKGGEFNQAVAPLNEGKSPSIGNPLARLPDMELFVAIVIRVLWPAPPGLIPLMRDCSSRLVPASDKRVNTLLSQPERTAATASNTATPKLRLTHSPAPSDFFKTANTRPPARMATANDVAAPAA